MAKHNFNQGFYLLVDLFPFMAFLLFLIFIVLLYTFLWLKSLCSKSYESNTFIPSLNRKIAKLALTQPSGMLTTEKPLHSTLQYTELPSQLHIRGKETLKSHDALLALYTISFSLFAFAVFWDIFLIRESHGCDDTTIDCFPANISSFDLRPIDDCSRWEKVNVTITCFTFVYEFGTALSAFGGLITMLRLLMSTISALLLWCHNGALNNRHCRSCCGISAAFVQYFLAVTLILVSFGGLVAFLALSGIDRPTDDFVGGILDKLSLANFLEIIAFMLIVGVGLLFPWQNYTKGYTSGINPLTSSELEHYGSIDRKTKHDVLL